MICRNCPEGRRFMAGSIFCNQYGMIIREKHECTRLGGLRHDRDGDQREDGGGTAEIQEDSCGAAGAVQGVLQGSEERAGLFGMESREEWEE